jgi:hypothetical protein
MIGEWRETVTGAPKSVSGDLNRDVKKSSRVGSASDVAAANGWESRESGKGPQVFIHGENPGIELRVGDDSEWMLMQGRQGPGEVNGGDSDTERYGAAGEADRVPRGLVE